MSESLYKTFLRKRKEQEKSDKNSFPYDFGKILSDIIRKNWIRTFFVYQSPSPNPRVRIGFDRSKLYK